MQRIRPKKIFQDWATKRKIIATNPDFILDKNSPCCLSKPGSDVNQEKVKKKYWTRKFEK
jgi:hypothetical protein